VSTIEPRRFVVSSTKDRARLEWEARQAHWAWLEEQFPRTERERRRLFDEVKVDFDMDAYVRARELASEVGSSPRVRTPDWKLVASLQQQLRTFDGFCLVCDQVGAMSRARQSRLLDATFDSLAKAQAEGWRSQALRLDLLADLFELALELVDQADGDDDRLCAYLRRRTRLSLAPLMSSALPFGSAVDMTDPPEPGDLPDPTPLEPVAAPSPHRARQARPWLGDLDALLARVVERPLDAAVWSALRDTALSDLQVLEDEVSGARDHYGLCHYSESYADDPLKKSAFVGSEPELASADLDDEDRAVLFDAEMQGAAVPWYFRRGVTVEPETASGFQLVTEFDPFDVLALTRLDELATQFVSAEDRFDVDPRDWLIDPPARPWGTPDLLHADRYESMETPGGGLIDDLDGRSLVVDSALAELRAYHAFAATRVSQLEAFAAREGRSPDTLDELEAWLDEWDVRRVNGRDDDARRRAARAAWWRSLPASERARLRAEWFGDSQPAPDLVPGPVDDEAVYAASWE
jgi:hypothetical protein